MCLLERGKRGQSVMEVEEVLGIVVRGINVCGRAENPPFLFHQGVGIA